MNFYQISDKNRLSVSSKKDFNYINLFVAAVNHKHL